MTTKQTTSNAETPLTSAATTLLDRIRFDLDDAQAASDAWRFNCGPAALCAVLAKTPNEIRPHLLEFENKGYTNPALMANILRGLRIPFQRVFEQTGRCHRNALMTPQYPRFGLVRIQWDGPWCDPGRPAVARYRHTHWVAMATEQATSWRCDARPMPQPGWPGRLVFDVNAMCVGGWISWDEWANELTPWLIGQVEPRANGNWWPTHCWQLSV